MPKKIRLFLLMLLLIVCFGIGFRAGNDLSVYYRVAQWAQSGKVLRIYAENATLGGFYYGPVAIALLKPLGALTFGFVHWLWLSLEILAFLVFWKTLGELYPSLKDSRALGLWILVWILSIKPIHACFQSYNIQLFVAAGLTTAELWSKRKDFFAILAGALISFFACIKLFPLFIAVYYLLARNNRVRLGLVVGALFSLLLPILAFGLSAGIALPEQFISTLHGYNETYSLATSTFFLSLPSLFAYWLPPRAAHVLTLLSIGGVSLAFFGFALKQRQNEAMSRDIWALALALMALLNPASRPDYFVFFVPAFCSLAAYFQARKLSTLAWSGALLAFALLAFLTEWTLRSRALNHLLEAWRVPVVGMILLCLVLGFSLRYNSKGEARPYTS